MPANVETMFYVRETPWHDLGTRVEEALTSEEALEISGLNWQVIQKPLYANLNNPLTPMGLDIIDGYKANIRQTDNQILGVVSDNYKVIQNKDAFSFVDELLDNNDIRYETAGSLANGKRIWLLAKMPEQHILDDEIIPYLVFTTGHDGRNLTRVAITPIRVVCQNTLNLALDKAQRAWSTKHTGDITMKLDEAKNTLGFASKYMDALNTNATQLANKIIETAIFNDFVKSLYPINDDASLITIGNIEAKRMNLNDAYYKTNDIEKFVGTAWGVINAVSDVATHNLSARHSKEAAFAKTIDGHPLIDKAYEILTTI